MMTDTSFFTFSAGRVGTETEGGARLRPPRSGFVGFRFASAKQTLLPPGKAVYAPQSPYWPSKVGCASPAGVAGATAVAAGLAGAAAGFCGCGVAAGFGGCCCANAADASDVARINAVADLIPVIGPPPFRLPQSEAGDPQT